MAHVGILVLVAGAVAMSGGIAAGQSMSSRICAAATESFADASLLFGLRNDVLVASPSLSSATPWAQLSQWTPTPIAKGIPALFVAYIHNAHPSEASGAISVKISVVKDTASKSTPSVEIHRPAIAPGTNRCERRGRRAVERQQIPVNEYIDYHDRKGNSDYLEDFHFKYPYGVDQCAATNQPNEVAATYQFPDVHRTTGDTVISRLQLIGPAYAINHKYSKLRSELHYYNRPNSTTACAGFVVPFDGISTEASVIIHDLSSSSFSARGPWSIVRQ